MLTPRELADARADYADCFLGQRATLLRATDETVKGRTETCHKAAGDGNGKIIILPCRVGMPKGEKIGEVASRVQADADAQIELPFGAKVEAGDRLDVGGQIYSIIGTDAGRTEALCLVCQVSKMS